MSVEIAYGETWVLNVKPVGSDGTSTGLISSAGFGISQSPNNALSFGGQANQPDGSINYTFSNNMAGGGTVEVTTTATSDDGVALSETEAVTADAKPVIHARALVASWTKKS